MPNELTPIAKALYKPPFRFDPHGGFIWDANNQMVCDDKGQDSTQRVRGWGRIGYMLQAEKIQDEVGRLIAQALTEFWGKPSDPRERLNRAFLAGFNAAGQGFNGEYPFRDSGNSPEYDQDFVTRRDQDVDNILKGTS